ncbi:hypothetical protein [Undibacterium flavidum]|uniref:Uncharacterized protein n=1 Tax=Undibacterium flavidum TaxID=2762297 RepID=A0ABR6Y9P1_9BURK|nr:hypothetical protein [Undibacterium flavidum]MBC3873363.1 hypothetical protein [Undibacterium flavidum]
MAAYSGLFFTISHDIIYPYERENFLKQHIFRPTYNIIFYPLRWFVANGSSLNVQQLETHHGRLKLTKADDEDKEMRSTQIETFDGAEIHIGFTGSQRVLTLFDEVNAGKFVKMTFGVALSKTSDSFINRLIDIEVIELIDDPRIKFEKNSEEDDKKIHQLFNELSGKSKVCADKFIQNYQELVLKHCEQSGYAESIGGGCYHIVGRSLHTGVLKHVLKVCEVAIN